jgi:polyhydroxyalkanoate synthesis regulator protein
LNPERTPGMAPVERRVIKYTRGYGTHGRKFYDFGTKRYVNLSDVMLILASDSSAMVVDDMSGNDMTSKALAMTILKGIDDGLLIPEKGDILRDSLLRALGTFSLNGGS